jgi:hypothetical protein
MNTPINQMPASLKYVLGIGPDPDPRPRAKCHHCDSLFRLDPLARDIVCQTCIERHKTLYPITIKKKGVIYKFGTRFTYRVWVEHASLPNRSGMLQVQVGSPADGWQSNRGYPQPAASMTSAMVIIHNLAALRVQEMATIGGKAQ